MIGLEFVVLVFAFGAMALILASPVFVMGWRRNRLGTFRRFLIAAVVVGLACAAVSVNSSVLVSQCGSAGYTACIDYGATGFQTLLLTAYALTSWVAAYLLSRD